MASEAENQEINQLIDEIEDDIIMTMNNTCSPEVVKKTNNTEGGGGAKDDTTSTSRMSRTPSFHEEPTTSPDEKGETVSSNRLPTAAMNGNTTKSTNQPRTVDARPPASLKDNNALESPPLVEEEELPLMEEANWNDLREFEIKTRRLPVPYTGYQNDVDDDDFNDAWPRWHWSRGRRRPRPALGWYDIRVAPPPPRNVSHLRYLHMELPQTKLDSKKGIYTVVVKVAPCTTLPQFGFWQGKLRFLGNPKTYAHVAKGQLRKRFDVVCSIDGQSVLHKSFSFILTQLVSPPDVTTRTIRLRPFERMMELEAVPDKVGSILDDEEMEVIEIDDDEASVEVIMENVSEEIPTSALNDDDDAIYSSDDDSYEREIKAGIRARAKPKRMSDDLSSKADDDSDFVAENIDEDADMDLDFDTTAGLPPKEVSVAKPAPKLKPPPQRQPPPQAAVNLYARQMQHQPQPKFQFQSHQPQVVRGPHGAAAPPSMQLGGASAFYRQNNPVYMAPSPARPTTEDYQVIVPVTPTGLGIRVCENKGKIVFIGYSEANVLHPCRHAFRKVGDVIVAIDGLSVERATPYEVTHFLKQNKGKSHRTLLMRTGWAGV